MKRFSLWFAVAFVLFSFQGGVAKPTQEQLDSLRAFLVPLSPPVSRPDIINYDSVGIPGPRSRTGRAYFDTTDYWMATKFVPTKSAFSLDVVYYQVDNSLVNTAVGCNILVAKDDSGGAKPGTILYRDTIQRPLASVFRSLELDSVLPFGNNVPFWILLGPVPGGPDPDTADVGDGWWGFGSDHQLGDSLRSYIRFKNDNSWTPGTLNWVIRAGGVFSPLPRVVINEVMFNADTLSSDPSRNHEWVELYNPRAVQTTQGWKIRNGDTTKSFSLPDGIRFDSAAYLVVHFAPGPPPDLDLSDYRGDIYVDSSRFIKDKFFDNRKDACGLYVGVKDPTSYLTGNADIVAWNLANLGVGTDSSSRTNLEFKLDFKAANRIVRIQPQGGIGPLLSASAGISIGRDDSSSNFPSPPSGRNLYFTGGPNAAGPTMGKKNLLPMVFDVSSQTAPPSAPWTIMLYIAGDYGENLLRSPDRWYYDILNQIERVMPTVPDSVNVIVLLDARGANLTGSSGTYHATFEGALRHDETDNVVWNLQFISPSVNTGKDTTLANFLIRARTNYPASDHYVLALMGDGAGWEGLCGDSGSVDRLEMGELKSALQTGLGGTKLDLLIFDAPLMSQLEVANQVKNFAHRMVASPEMISPADFDYPRLVEAFKGGINTSTLVANLKNILKNRTGQDPFAVWTVINLDNLDLLTRHVDTLAVHLTEGTADPCRLGDIPDSNYQLKNIRRALTNYDVDHYGTQAQGMADFVDLRRFAFLIKTFPLSDCLRGDHKKGADSVVSLLRRNGVVIEGLEGGGFSGSNAYHQNLSIPLFEFGGSGGGLSIYFPSARQRATPIFPKNFQVGPISAAVYRSRSDHPFDSIGLETEGGVSQVPRIYASDLGACYPHSGTACNPSDSSLARNHPFSPVDSLDFVQNYHWDEFLIRYYKPVADMVVPGGTDKKLNASFELNATGTSDPDDDFSSLSFYWDTSAADNSTNGCLDYLLDDLDKNCDDNSSDDADRTGSPVTLKFSQSGDHQIWLHVWDPTDSDQPNSLRRFQTAKTVVEMRIQFRGVQTYFEELGGIRGVKSLYTRTLDSVGPSTGRPPHEGLDLDRLVDRVNFAESTIIQFATSPPQSPKPQVLWSTGSVSDSTFPRNCQAALNLGLRAQNLDIGAVFFNPKAGGATDLTSRKYFDSLGFTFSPDSQLTGYIRPDSLGNSVFHFGLDSLPRFPLFGGAKQLRTLVDTCGVFPILRTDSGKIVAAARVLVTGRHGIVFCTFGLEDINEFSDGVFILDKILSWLSLPINPDSLPICCVKGDVNGDGNLTGADAAVASLLINARTGNGDSCAADVNCSGSLTSADFATLLLMVYAGAPAPCGSSSDNAMEVDIQKPKTRLDWQEAR